MADRSIITDGPHTEEVIRILGREIEEISALDSIRSKASKVIESSVDPIAGPPEHPSDGLLYGLIQSGKTSIITVGAAMAADNGFQCILILTSDNDPLYDQTLERVIQALRGLKVLGKNDWKDAERFERQLRTPPFAIVCSKNSSKLNSLLDAFRVARAKGISVLIIDDEADQASLNTHESAGGNQISTINQAITNFRDFFKVNTYLQVTATPQALFLQRPDHRYRPSFTILSQPGPGYVGGEVFFGQDDKLLRFVDVREVDQLRITNQPSPNVTVPIGLKEALFTFLIGASAKIISNPGEGYAFLCHVSVMKKDHEHIVSLIDRFTEDVRFVLQDPTSSKYLSVITDLQNAYNDLSQTESALPKFDDIIAKIKFYIGGADVRLINASSNEEIKLDSVYNIFVGGNKLGRGVTIKNLLVSYYGRNPQRPNADTVLQHARMYGYRRNTISLTRLFLPKHLAEHFRSIHLMEKSLRELIEKNPEGKFEGLYITNPLNATRRNVLDPNSIGIYVAGGYCNPTYPLRTSEVKSDTVWLDEQLSTLSDNGPNMGEYTITTIGFLKELIKRCKHDPEKGADLWNIDVIETALTKIESIKGEKAYLRVKRDRDLNAPRLETQNYLSGGEEKLVPRDSLTLFMYRLRRDGNRVEAWWPCIRWPDGNYVLAFSF